jgi:hypothetical protein
MKHEELLRTDLTDGQDGLPLLLDIGVMDVTTCTPLENALVDVCEFIVCGKYCSSSLFDFYRAL